MNSNGSLIKTMVCPKGPPYDDDGPIVLDWLLDRPRPRRTPQPTSTEGMVYFARRGDGRIKIGHSRNPERRLRDLETGAGPLKLLRQEPGGPAREGVLHAQFEADREHGEWFRASQAILDYLEGERVRS